jgi:radical SAM superfamily enzyme YgiQ (UPF0313 family)
MAKILVINPFIIDFKLYDEWMHPLGLYFFMSMLHQNNHSITYYNCLTRDAETTTRKFNTGTLNFREIEKPDLYIPLKRKYKCYGVSESAFLSFLNSAETPDIICLGTTMTYWAPGILYTANLIRTVFPNIPIITGGIASQLLPGYFENRISNCIQTGHLEDLKKNAFLLKVLGPLNQTSSFKDALPYTSQLSHGAMLVSLGCPMHCSYCASKSLQKKYQPRSLQDLSDEFEYYIFKKNVYDFAFYDDALLYEPETVLLPFVKKIRQYNKPVTFHTPNGLHLRYVEKDLFTQLREAGFRTLRFGFESSSAKHKNDTCEKILKNEIESKLKILMDSGFSPSDIGIYIMAGLKGQTPEDVLGEMHFINSLSVKVKPVFLSPVPTTRLYNEYSLQFPEILTNPLWHNDSFFITQLEGWHETAIESIRMKAREYNQKISNKTI